jgi:hypothetical protein
MVKPSFVRKLHNGYHHLHEEVPVGNGMSNNIPPIPHQVSNDCREIFDWAMNVGKAVAKQHRINDLMYAVHKRSACGECTKWMCSGLCPKEVLQRNGRYIGPSMTGAICNIFEEKSWDTENRKKLKEELDKLLAS